MAADKKYDSPAAIPSAPKPQQFSMEMAMKGAVAAATATQKNASTKATAPRLARRLTIRTFADLIFFCFPGSRFSVVVAKG